MFFTLTANELLDVTAYGLRSDFLSPETMPKATVELALTKNRKLLLASVLAKCILFIINRLYQLSKSNWFFKPLRFLLNSRSFLNRFDSEKLSAYKIIIKCKLQFLFYSRLGIARVNLSNSRLFFQISRSHKAKIYQTRICCQNATRNQSPKSERLLIPIRYQTQNCIEREMVDFFFLIFLLTSCWTKRLTVCEATSYRPRRCPSDCRTCTYKEP